MPRPTNPDTAKLYDDDVKQLKGFTREQLIDIAASRALGHTHLHQRIAALHKESVDTGKLLAEAYRQIGFLTVANNYSSDEDDE